jgi:hypothetical protein
VRRKRSDSVTKEGLIMREGAPSPPAHITLRKQDWPFWESILSVKDFSSWTNTDLEQAAILARCNADIERLQHEIDKENEILKNAAGSFVINPKLKLMDELIRRSIVISRLLQIHAAATQGEARHQVNRNKKHKELKEDVENLDPLIARPIH